MPAPGPLTLFCQRAGNFGNYRPQRAVIGSRRGSSKGTRFARRVLAAFEAGLAKRAGKRVMVDDVERLRDLAHRLWIAEGRPDIPRHELMRRAADILARQERMLRNGRDTADIVHLSKAVSES